MPFRLLVACRRLKYATSCSGSLVLALLPGVGTTSLEYATSCSGSLVLALLPGVGTTFRLRSMLRYSGSDFDVRCLGEPRMYALECDKFWLVIVSYGVAKLPRR